MEFNPHFIAGVVMTLMAIGFIKYLLPPLVRLLFWLARLTGALIQGVFGIPRLLWSGVLLLWFMLIETLVEMAGEQPAPGNRGGGTGGGGRSGPPDPHDPLYFIRAMNYLADHTGSRREFDAAYRAAMKRVHPDAGGSARAAQQLNEARDVIRESKGW
jgi:hypothetical protein